MHPWHPQFLRPCQVPHKPDVQFQKSTMYSIQRILNKRIVYYLYRTFKSCKRSKQAISFMKQVSSMNQNEFLSIKYTNTKLLSFVNYTAAYLVNIINIIWNKSELVLSIYQVQSVLLYFCQLENSLPE